MLQSLHVIQKVFQLQIPLGLGLNESQEDQNLANRVNIPTIRTSNPLIFTMSKHLCELVH